MSEKQELNDSEAVKEEVRPAENAKRTIRNADIASAPLPVRVVKPVRVKGNQTMLWVQILCAILLCATAVFSGVIAFRCNEQMNELNKTISELNDQIAGMNTVQISATSSTSYFSWSDAAPFAFTVTDENGLASDASADISFTNTGTAALFNASASIDTTAIQSIVSVLNAKDDVYSYTATIENDKLTLEAAPKEEDSYLETITLEGSLKSETATLLGNGANSLKLTLSEPVRALLDRLAALDLANSANLSFTLSGTDASSEPVSYSFVASLSNVDVTNENGMGYGEYTLNVSQ